MNHGQDTVSGEAIRMMIADYEERLGVYHSVRTATGGRYESPEDLLEHLLEELRVYAPEPKDEDENEEDDDKWQDRLGREQEALIQKANDEHIEDQFPDLDVKNHLSREPKTVGEITRRLLKEGDVEDKKLDATMKTLAENIGAALKDEGDSI